MTANSTDAALSLYDGSAYKSLPIPAEKITKTLRRFEHLTIVLASETDGPVRSRGEGAIQTISVPLNGDDSLARGTV